MRKLVNGVRFSLVIADPDLELILCRRLISGFKYARLSRFFEKLRELGMDEPHAWRASLFAYCKSFINQIEKLTDEISNRGAKLRDILDDLVQILAEELELNV